MYQSNPDAWGVDLLVYRVSHNVQNGVMRDLQFRVDSGLKDLARHMSRLRLELLLSELGNT